MELLLNLSFRGGAVTYRVVLWHPDLVSHVFTVIMPYTPPSESYISLEDLATERPPFKYQLQLASGEVEKQIQTRENIRQFLKGMFGATGPGGELLFTLFGGIQFDNLPNMKDPTLLSPKVSVRSFAFEED